MGKIGLPHFRIPDDLEPVDFRCITLQVPDDMQYIEDFRLMLEILSKWNNYERTGDDSGARASRVWRNVVNNVDWLGLCAGPELPDEDEGCFEIGPFHPALTYWPNHPILTPGHKPNEYAEPAWQTGAGEIGLTGADAWINNASISTPLIVTDLWEVGVPSVTLNFEGAGEIDLTFVDAVQGGQVWVFPDGNFLVGHRVDLSHIDIADLADLSWFFDIIELLTGNPVNEVHDQVQFDTDGPHTLTMWFLPLGESPPYVGFGGGLRRVQLCGAITLSETVVMPYTIARSGCDIVLSLDGAPVSTIEDVFYTDAACAITNTTFIQRSSHGNFTALELGNLDPAPETSTLLSINMRGITPLGFLSPQTYINSRWGDIANARGRLTIGVYGNGTSKDVVRINASDSTMLLRHHASLGQSEALQLIRAEGGFNTTNALRVLTGSRTLGGLSWDGQLRAFKRNNVSNSVVAAIQLSAFADGVTPAAGFGPSIAFTGQSSTTEDRNIAGIEAVWATATDAAREGIVRHKVYNYAGNVTPLQYGNQDGLTAIGFHGISPITRPEITGNDVISVVNNLLAGFEQYGLIDDLTSIVPIATDSGAYGDPNLPPDDVDNYCFAANGIPTILLGDLDQAEIRVSAQGVLIGFDEFRYQHGYILENLWLAMTEINANLAGWAALYDEIDDAEAGMVLALAPNPYSRANLIAWAAGALTTEAAAVFNAWVVTYTEAKWKENVYRAYRNASSIFPCTPCENEPQAGNDWRVEWSAGALASDWSVFDCGDGFSMEWFCGTSPFEQALDLGFTPLNAATFTVTRIEVTLSYDINTNKTVDGLFRGASGSGNLPLDAEVLTSGVGTTTMVMSGTCTVTSGFDFRVELWSDNAPSVGDFITVTNINIEGTGTAPDSTGDTC